MSGVPSGTNIPRTTKTTLRRGDNHPAVWSFQMAFNSLDDINRGHRLTADGDFGPATEEAAKIYQRSVEITADGIVGPATQQRLARSLVLRAEKKHGSTPKGLVIGQIQAESGGYLGAVNWSVAGGVDCGITQRRVTEPYTQSAVRMAFDPAAQVDLLVLQLIGRVSKFLSYGYVNRRSDRNEYAWRLAALEHNWPAGASTLASGRQLSTKVASWVPKGTKFADGTPVVTFRDWAKFYAMGSKAHRHVGAVVAQAYGVPIDG